MRCAASGATVSNGASQVVEAGGSAIGTVVGGGGTQLDYGYAGGATVLNGASLVVEAGGSASGTVVNGLRAVGTINVLGIATNTSVGFGQMNVSAGGTAIDTSVFAGTLGGVMNVSSGGTASGVSVGSRGTLNVSSGGTASGVSVGSGGTALTAPRVAFAQATDRMRRIGVLMPLAVDDPEAKVRLAAFLDGLQQLGWTDGRNVRIDARWPGSDADRFRKYAAELVALEPGVILASSSTSVAALQRITRSVPIVFAAVIDPVGAGFVESMARPGGNTTGFGAFEYSLSGKWLELLKEIAPNLTRAAVLRDPTFIASIGQFAVIQAMAPSSFAAELAPIDMRDPGEIEHAITAFARKPNGGLIVTATPLAATYRDLIISLATRYRLPNVYAFRYYPASGGLASYGPGTADEFKRAADYVDRILKGAKPADLPVQSPTNYQLVINLKTATALGLVVPTALLARADEVIE